jgi:hypothetical protein
LQSDAGQVSNISEDAAAFLQHTATAESSQTARRGKKLSKKIHDIKALNELGKQNDY